MSMHTLQSTRKLTVKRGTGNEARKMKRHMRDFDVRNCKAWKILTEKFPSRRFRDLSSIASLVCDYSSDLKLSREAARDKRALVKWFDDNLATAIRVLDNIDQLDEDNEKLTNKTKTNG